MEEPDALIRHGLIHKGLAALAAHDDHRGPTQGAGDGLVAVGIRLRIAGEQARAEPRVVPGVADNDIAGERHLLEAVAALLGGELRQQREKVVDKRRHPDRAVAQADVEVAGEGSRAVGDAGDILEPQPHLLADQPLGTVC